MEYKVKTPVIQAVYFDHPNVDDIKDYFHEYPEWLRDAVNLGIITTEYDEGDLGVHLKIKRSGTRPLKIIQDQWIICAPDENSVYPQIYSCPSNIFHKIYKET